PCCLVRVRAYPFALDRALDKIVLFFLMFRRPLRPPLFPYTTLFRSCSGPPPRGTTGRGRRSVRSARHVPTPQAYLSASLHTPLEDRKSTRLNSSHVKISYAVFCLKKKKPAHQDTPQQE